MWYLVLNRRTKDGTWSCLNCKAKIQPRLLRQTIKCKQCGHVHRHSKKYFILAIGNSLLVLVVALLGWSLIQRDLIAWYFGFLFLVVPLPGLWQLAAWQRSGEYLEVITDKKLK